MGKAVFFEHDGTRHCIEVTDGRTLMEAAVLNRVPGMIARCGGAGGCATCQVHVEASWEAAVGTASREELRTLRYAYQKAPNSRLACQITMRPALDGVVLRLPPRQF